MMRHLALASLLLATPALATDKPGGDTYNQHFDNSQNLNFFQKIDQRLSSIAEANQKQRQDQAQAQGQTQTATGGSANNSNNVSVDNRTQITNAPTVIGNGDTYAGSVGIAGIAAGIAVPSRAYGRGQIGRNILELSADRRVLYTQCGLPDTERTLALFDVRCDLHGQAFTDHENGIRQAEYLHRKAQWERQEKARRAAAAAKNNRPRVKPACGC